MILKHFWPCNPWPKIWFWPIFVILKVFWGPIKPSPSQFFQFPNIKLYYYHRYLGSAHVYLSELRKWLNRRIYSKICFMTFYSFLSTIWKKWKRDWCFPLLNWNSFLELELLPGKIFSLHFTHRNFNKWCWKVLPQEVIQARLSLETLGISSWLF